VLVQRDGGRMKMVAQLRAALRLYQHAAELISRYATSKHYEVVSTLNMPAFESRSL
jgi:hypothetical protein